MFRGAHAPLASEIHNNRIDVDTVDHIQAIRYSRQNISIYIYIEIDIDIIDI